MDEIEQADLRRGGANLSRSEMTQKDYRRRAWYYGKRRRTFLMGFIRALPPGQIFRTDLIWEMVQRSERPSNWEKSEWFQETTVERILIEFGEDPKVDIEAKKADLVYRTEFDDGSFMEQTRRGWLFRKMDAPSNEVKDREETENGR